MNKKYVLPSVLFLSIYGATVTTWAEESAVYDVEGNTNTAASPTGKGKFNFRKLIRPESNTNYNTVKLAKLSNFNLPAVEGANSLPVVGANNANVSGMTNTNSPVKNRLNLIEAVQLILQRHPDIAQDIANIAAQNANIDAAKAGYYPQISGGMSSANLSQKTDKGQLFSLSASQMVYDFGKVKSGVDLQKTKLTAKQAETLKSIDDIAYDAAKAVVNLKRYQEICRIAQQQVQGISRISEIAQLRAKAGISSQADPVQAQSYVQSAESNYFSQLSNLKQYQQKLRTLMGSDVEMTQWDIPVNLVNDSGIYGEPNYNQIPSVMLAQAELEIAKAQKQQVALSVYPTLKLKGEVNQAVGGLNPNNDKQNGRYSSVVLQVDSNFFQGGAVSAQKRAAAYAEQAAQEKISSSYRDVLEQQRMLQEEIETKQQQISILANKQKTSIRTRELYQEQYKLGTRTVVDLLNAEQAIHTANMEIENARYDIYASLVQYIALTGRSHDVYQLNNLSIQGFEIQP